MTLTLGDRVRYLLTAEQAAEINSRRFNASVDPGDWRPTGVQVHVGSRVIDGDVVALDVTKVSLDGQINGRALLDGNDVLWVTGVSEGTEPGTWQRPVGK